MKYVEDDKLASTPDPQLKLACPSSENHHRRLSEWPCSLYILHFQMACGKESACQCRRCRRLGFDSWVGAIPWSGKWQCSLVFLPGKSHGQVERGGLQSTGLQRVRHDWAHTRITKLPFASSFFLCTSFKSLLRLYIFHLFQTCSKLPVEAFLWWLLWNLC